MSTVKMTGLADEIMHCLNEYTDEVIEALDKAEESLAEEGVQELKKTSPRKTGKYARSWTQKKFRTKHVIHSKKPRYRLTHLLEHGHAKRNGGRVAAITHIKPVEDKLMKEIPKKIKEALGK